MYVDDYETAHLGTALRQQGRLGESHDAFRSAMNVQASATALINLGTILVDLGQLDAAYDYLIAARDIAPHIPQIHINRAPIQRDRGDEAAALESLATAEELRPGSAELHTNRGNLLLHLGQPVEAVSSFQQAIAIDSSAPLAVSGLGRALEKIGYWEESLEAHKLAKDLNPSNHEIHSSYLYATCLSPLLSPQEIRERHAAWGNLIEGNTPVRQHANDRSPDRPLRIGYVSPDFRNHATMKFLLPMLQAHDRSLFRLYFYSQTAKEDKTTAETRKLGDGWCAARMLSDDQLADRIQQDQIDILVDLAGHTVENRLPVFARKPAPIQVSFLGYPATTGLNRIDYYLSDAVHTPPEFHSLFTEQIVLLPHGLCCYHAGDSCDVAPPPHLAKKHITLGSTHRLEKISQQTLVIWSQVMTLLPNAELLVFRDVLKSEDLRAQTLQQFTDAGIDPARVRFGWELPSPHLKVYSEIDILLDVFPWGSGTTAYDAMWMGVPVPSLMGDRCSSRGAASLLNHSGFPELAGSTVGDYLQIMTDLANNPTRLQEMRQALRPAMQATVGNGKRFAKDVETAYRRMWTQLVTNDAAESEEEECR
ncbi:MAG: hypothetical protein GY903_08520 [Fuerstiella sp.]|nr:hypothetical protein [Fuerstiella sp.]